MAVTLPRWVPRVIIALVAMLALVWFALGWLHANDIRSEFLIAKPHLTGYPLEVISNEAGRVVVPRTDETDREGLWGLESDDSYAQVSTIVRITEDTIERGVKSLEGSLESGDAARIDADAFTGDPFSAHRIGYEDLVVPADIGPHPGWFIDGRRSTWILFVHGEGDDRLGESLRLIPSLVEQGYPIMVIAYRNDVGATPSDSGMRLWGLEEWRDVDAAVQLGVRKGAKDFVIVGSGFGASIASTFLHESEQIATVRGAIYETPVIDLEGVVRRWASDNGTPRIVGWLGRRLATVRFGMEWNELDQIARAEEFDVPMLVLTGGEDTITDAGETEAWADSLGDLAVRTRFEQAAHTDLWNIDQPRYESTIREWLTALLGPE